jgi:hypothetical protein
VKKTSTENPPQVDVAERERMFKRLVTAMFLFAAHALAILLVLDAVFH